MEKCPVCNELKKGKFWCSACKTVFTCPMQNCGAEIRKQGTDSCPRCGLYFPDYVSNRKMYRRCPKCKKKAGSFGNSMQVLQTLVQLPHLRSWRSVHQHVDLPAVWNKFARMKLGQEVEDGRKKLQTLVITVRVRRDRQRRP